MADRYQIFKKANHQSAEKKSISELECNVPYVVLAIRSFEHEEYGTSIKVNIRDCHKKQFFTYLPARIAKTMQASHIEGFIQDIKEKRPPFLVYFGKSGKAFDVEFYPFNLETARKALKGEKIIRTTTSTKEEDPETDDLEWLEAAVASTTKD